MGERRVFTKEFKERAVEPARNTNWKHSEIAQDLGINRNMSARWMREMKRSETGHMKAFTGRGNTRDEETARLRREIVDLRETNEILKKARAIFTVGNPRQWRTCLCGSIKDGTPLRRRRGNWGQVEAGSMRGL
ncbi:MAG: transposase [Treponema sp.]|jgi:transposase|nr:transposase [Treponema sp.]